MTKFILATKTQCDSPLGVKVMPLMSCQYGYEPLTWKKTDCCNWGYGHRSLHVLFQFILSTVRLLHSKYDRYKNIIILISFGIWFKPIKSIMGLRIVNTRISYMPFHGLVIIIILILIFFRSHDQDFVQFTVPWS